jgi:hypothetical protein
MATVLAYDNAEAAFLRVESALSPLRLLVHEDSVAMRAAGASGSPRPPLSVWLSDYGVTGEDVRRACA